MLSGTPTSASSIVWTWNAPVQAGGLQGYRVVDAITGTPVSPDLSNTTTQWTDPNLLSDTDYTRRIEAFNAVMSSDSAGVTAHTLVRNFTGVPDAPERAQRLDGNATGGSQHHGCARGFLA